MQRYSVSYLPSQSTKSPPRGTWFILEMKGVLVLHEIIFTLPGQKCLRCISCASKTNGSYNSVVVCLDKWYAKCLIKLV